MMELAPGLAGEIEIVTAGNTGVHVLVTPRLVALLGDAAIRTVQAQLGPGSGTVGTQFALKHLAATPVGMRVRGRAVLRQIDGRRLVYDVEARKEVEKVAEGTHERFQITQARFLDRVAEKAKRH